MLKKVVSWKFLAVSLIFVLAAFLRLWNLAWNPPALNWDEVSHGYNAYSILKTGADEWGQSLPLTAFRAFGDYKLPLYIYSVVPFVAIFGLNEWTVRLPSALAGIGAVIFTFFLIQKLFGDFKLAAISSLLLAISPWSLMISRAAFEANLGLFLVIFATWLFLKSLANYKLLPFAFLVFSLSLYTYNSAKIFVPIFVIFLIIFYRRELLARAKFLIASILLFILFFIPHLLLVGSAEGQARFYWTTILDQGAINRINEARVSSSLPPPLPVLINNRVVFFVTTSIKNWATHFSPGFLFFQGGSHFQYSIPGKGVAYPIEAPFLLFGLILLLILRQKSAILILFWLLLGPAAASVTRESPNVLRSIFVLPALQALTAAGLVKSTEWFGKYNRYFIGLVLILIFVFASLFQKEYFAKYRKNYSFSWQYGYKQLAQFLQFNESNYDRIVISKKYGEPHEFLLFYQKVDPKLFQTDPNLIRCPRSNWFWVDKFDKFEFVNDWEVKNLKKDQILPAACPQEPKKLEVGKMLLVTSPENFPAGGNLVKTIDFLNGEPAFDLVEY